MKKAIDPYTKNSISKETYTRAKKINTLFTIIVARKIRDGKEVLTREQQLLFNKLDDFANVTLNDIINPVDELGGKFKL